MIDGQRQIYFAEVTCVISDKQTWINQRLVLTSNFTLHFVLPEERSVRSSAEIRQGLGAL